MFGLSIGVIVACSIAVWVGATVQASTGIGVGMIASPVLAWADPAFVPAAILICVLPLTMSVAWIDRAHVRRRDVGVALIGRVPGIVVGAYIAVRISATAIAVLVGVTVLAAVLLSITVRKFRPTDRALMVAGLASGFTGTTTGVGGPPMALTYQHSDPATMRSTISAFFAIGTLLSIGALVVAGEVGDRQWELGLLLLPAVGLGVVTSRKLQHRVDPATIRPVVLTICAVAAIALLIETL